MPNEIIPSNPDLPTALHQAGQAANKAAAKHVFEDYRSRKAANTLTAHKAALDRFSGFLADVGAPPSAALNEKPEAWAGITWGLIEAYKKWMLDNGYAISTINLHLSAIKAYAKLASKAESLDQMEYLKIKDVSGFAQKEAENVNKTREITRRFRVIRKHGEDVKEDVKKAEHVSIPKEAARQLKRGHEDTPQGRRDALLMCLLIDLGLRCGEVALLKVDNVKLEDGQIKFKRPKVKKEQTHDMPRDLMRAMRAYFAAGDAPLLAEAPLLRGSQKGGKLTEAGMSERAITKRVKTLGRRVGITGLSAHDCRHYWATANARAGVDPFRLQEAGGWNSLVMPRRYVEAAEIANEGMVSV